MKAYYYNNDLRSPKMREKLNERPSFFIRSGTLVIFCIYIVIIAVCICIFA